MFQEHKMRLPVVAAILLLLAPAARPFANSCPQPEKLEFEVVRILNRSEIAFTQGLIYRNEMLLESTGAYEGDSVLNSIDPQTGEVTKITETPNDVYGEGLTQLGSELFQLSYKEGKIFVYDAETGALKRIAENTFSEQGWGLDTYQGQLIASDGSDTLTIVDPTTLEKIREVEVLGIARGLNELEVVDNFLYANIYPKNLIAKVDLTTGCTVALAETSPLLQHFTPAEMDALRSDRNHILNGIAFDPGTGEFYLTGKNWPKIFVVRFR